VGASIPLARRHLLLASLLAVAASLGTSYLLHRSYGSTLRVVIADDQEMVRSGFRLILEANGIEVVGEATTGVEAVRLGRDLRPDVCLRDIRMPGLDGLEATRQLAGPGIEDPIPVVVVTTFDLDDYVRTAIDNGPSGFLLKDAGAALLVEAVRAAANGDALVSPSTTVRFLAHFGGVREMPPQPPVTPLTERDEEPLVELAKGSTNAEIGAALHISLSTVKTHLGSIQAKFGARNRAEVAAWAWRTGGCAAAADVVLCHVAKRAPNRSIDLTRRYHRARLGE